MAEEELGMALTNEMVKVLLKESIGLELEDAPV